MPPHCASTSRLTRHACGVPLSAVVPGGIHQRHMGVILAPNTARFNLSAPGASPHPCTPAWRLLVIGVRVLMCPIRGWFFAGVGHPFTHCWHPAFHHNFHLPALGKVIPTMHSLTLFGLNFHFGFVYYTLQWILLVLLFTVTTFDTDSLCCLHIRHTFSHLHIFQF